MMVMLLGVFGRFGSIYTFLFLFFGVKVEENGC